MTYDPEKHLEYIARRMHGDANDAALWAQVDKKNRDWWRGFAVASLIAGRIAQIALDRRNDHD